ncbi:MAG: PAS domain S-box protein [Candidatus Methanoperedens sp.]|nr:PAS domain S-box protein [Candidatus Methanoperedens sp.]
MQIKYDTLKELEKQYVLALEDYVAEGEERALECAYELGRRAIADGQGILDIAAVHQRALASVLLRTQEREETMKKAGQFFAESIAPFEMTFRGFQESIIKLQNLNRTLEQSEMKFRSVVEAANDAIISSDSSGNIISWNKRAHAVFGYSGEEVMGKPLTILMPGQYEDVHLMGLGRIRSTGEFGYKGKTFESHGLRKDGTEFPIEISIAGWKTEDRAFYTGIIRDITEKKRLEVQLLRKQRMESIGTLAGGIAHDINNILTPIMLSLQILKEKTKDEQSRKVIAIMEQSSQRGADLIKQVLSFSRGIEGERKPLQITDQISEIEKVLKETFPRNIEIRTDIEERLFTISGDVTQINQILMNLCVNARDAMPDGGILNITASNFFIDENYARMDNEAKAGSYVIIGVSDTGVGISPEILDRIYEPFFTTKEFGRGTGLGLSTALAIVKSHGGFINVDSKVGKGTAFKVYLPSTIAETENADERQSPERGHGEWILVVDDEASIRDITTATLKSNLYNVIAAEDGIEAVALYSQKRKDIKAVLMDMAMPNMGGLACISILRKIDPKVKVIAVSGLTEKDKLAKVEDARIGAFLSKPYTADRLLRTIHEVISSK